MLFKNVANFFSHVYYVINLLSVESDIIICNDNNESEITFKACAELILIS